MQEDRYRDTDRPRRIRSLAHYFDHDPLAPLPLKLGVEHLLLRAEIERAPRDGEHHLIPITALEARIRLILAYLVMAILRI